MKATGIVRRVDVLGRVVVPKEIRKILGISEGDPLEIFTEKDGIVLKKYSPLSNMDEIANDIANALSRQTGKCVFICDKEVIISASGMGVKDVLGKEISRQILELILNKQTLVCSFEDGATPLKVTDHENFGFYNQLIMPIRPARQRSSLRCMTLWLKSISPLRWAQQRQTYWMMWLPQRQR